MNNKIFAIGDLHLPAGTNKTMDQFGPGWVDHWSIIKKIWQQVVSKEDLVLIPGDISWAMTLIQAQQDLIDIGILPGIKLLLRGNHDFWWCSIKKIKDLLPESLNILQNDAFIYGNYVICGSRGWISPDTAEFKHGDDKIYRRELTRMELSLKAGYNTGKTIIVMMHYPPFGDKLQDTPWTALFNQYKVNTVIYAHLHGASEKKILEGIHDQVRYHLVSCDYLNFEPKQII
jgi:predicted phosphohydrolase